MTTKHEPILSPELTNGLLAVARLPMRLWRNRGLALLLAFIGVVLITFAGFALSAVLLAPSGLMGMISAAAGVVLLWILVSPFLEGGTRPYN